MKTNQIFRRPPYLRAMLEDKRQGLPLSTLGLDLPHDYQLLFPISRPLKCLIVNTKLSNVPSIPQPQIRLQSQIRPETRGGSYSK